MTPSQNQTLFDLALHSLKAKVSKSELAPGASAMLQTGWVKMFEVPDYARNLEAVKLIAELAGEVVVVDELSLIREGPVRVKLNGRNITKLRGSVQVFINKVRYNIMFVPEENGTTSQVPKQGPPKKPEEDSEEEDDNARDNELEWERMKRINEEKEGSKDSHTEPGHEGGGAGGKNILNPLLMMTQWVLVSYQAWKW